MKKRLAVGGLIGAAVAMLGLAVPQVAPAQTPSGAVAALEKPVKDFALRDLMSGKTIKLSSYKGKQSVVLVFMANRCGTTWTYEKEIGQLVKDGKANGYQVLIVHSNYPESDSEIRGQLETRNIVAPVLDDKPRQVLADYLGAQVTPTFYVIDKSMVLRYIGAFDDHHAAPLYVKTALNSLRAGKPVTTPRTRAFG